MCSRISVCAASGLSQSFDTVGFGVGDADGDGDLDLVAARWGLLFYPSENDPALQRTELFWLNDGNGQFTDHSELLRYPLRSTRFTANGELSEVALTPNFADLDGDGDADLVLTQDFGMSTVLRNDTIPGELPRFTNTTDRNVINEDNGMGASLGDYDNDGDLDILVSGNDQFGQEELRVYRNNAQRPAGQGLHSAAAQMHAVIRQLAIHKRIVRLKPYVVQLQQRARLSQ